MADLRVLEHSGAATILGEAVVEEFRSSLRGRLLRAVDDDYDAARKIWNGMIDRRPALIARCAGAADVVRCVDFARAHNLLVAVRGGGHNVAGNAVCDGGLVIDLTGTKTVRVDPARRTARADAGVTWGEFDHETQSFGLATTGGQVSTTGIAGRRSEAAGGGWRESMAWPAITSCLSTSSPRTGSCARPAPPRTQTSSGACEAGAATSASSRPSSIGCIRSVPSSEGSCSIRLRWPERCSSAIAS